MVWIGFQRPIVSVGWGRACPVLSCHPATPLSPEAKEAWIGTGTGIGIGIGGAGPRAARAIVIESATRCEEGKANRK